MALVELGRYPSGAEAQLVVARLAADGIEAVVFDAGMNIADSSGWLVPARVMVLDEDEAEARAALD